MYSSNLKKERKKNFMHVKAGKRGLFLSVTASQRVCWLREFLELNDKQHVMSRDSCERPHSSSLYCYKKERKKKETN